MLAIGCTGGIGAGKSSVVALLAERGAVTLVADEYARRALAPGTPGFGAVVARFGASVLDPDGAIDRRALGRRVFADPDELAALEAVVHPEVHAALTAELDARRASDDVVVLELPLLVETGGRARLDLDGVLVVDAPENLAVERLVGRGLPADEARARIAAQAPAGERLRAADFVIVNIGTADELAAMVAEAWKWITRLAEERAGER